MLEIVLFLRLGESKGIMNLDDGLGGQLVGGDGLLETGPQKLILDEEVKRDVLGGGLLLLLVIR